MEQTYGIHTWFFKNQRSFPWREERTPYRVWISEVMLQQTRASVVVPYFLRWMEQFPNVRSLAASSLESVIKTWEGLGYYSRARHLHAGAKQIVEQFAGEIPDSKEALALIHGLGPYTIGAILNFGFRKRAAAIDGNVARVMSRYLALEENICKAKTRRFLEEKVERFLDEQEPWITTEALIELGAMVCQPKPRCGDCPLQNGCSGLRKGLAEALPIKNTQAPMMVLTRAATVIRSSEGQFLVRKEIKGKIMADLYEFPYFDIKTKWNSFRGIEKAVKRMLGLNAKCVCAWPEITHSFTKYKAFVKPFLLQTEAPVTVPNWSWVCAKQLSELPFSAGHRKIVKQVMEAL